MAKALPVSPLAPAGFPDLPAVAGVRFAAAAAGVKYEGRDDVMLAVLDPGTTVAGVFTQSKTRSAPVLDCEAKLGADRLRGDSREAAAFLVNAGNSNAFTGRAGDESVAALCRAVSAATNVPEARVFTASTGVIGERLPHDRIEAVMETLATGLDAYGLPSAARAIMTTDTFPKGAARKVEIDDQTVTIAGIAKGSGMIAPDMATLLVYLFTDARLSAEALQPLVADHNAKTFNAITVDSDTSTSDTLLVAATGATGIDATGHEAFATALFDVMFDLATQVVRDGEGASKLIRVRVTGAADNADARRAAMAVANSPLVKTAIAGEDANWGRIVMAIGKSGAAADRDRISIRFGEIVVAENGWAAQSYREEDGAAYMKRREIDIVVGLGVGDGTFTAYTCDLTHGYISINADYRS
ncbi:MAG: bifunctional glutamate N-acetyltransferase/amino-acid acetyltransferase ArgJ [Paracoccaceae bacterium]|nr:bifunctional glutamate N-acetyltransferase/amino-acid acetyltransferase ArgJ [Paracoccaceae bacterium]